MCIWMIFGVLCKMIFSHFYKADTPVLWPPHRKSWLTGNDSDAEKDWGQEEEGTTEDEMARWHHQLHGHEFEWTPGVGDEKRGLACCNWWGRKESDTTEWLNGTELIHVALHHLWLAIKEWAPELFGRDSWRALYLWFPQDCNRKIDSNYWVQDCYTSSWSYRHRLTAY